MFAHFDLLFFNYSIIQLLFVDGKCSENRY